MEYMQHICIMCTCGTKHYHYQQIYMYNVRLLLFPTLHYNNTPLRIWSTLEHSMDSNFSIHLGQSWKTAYDSYAIMPNRARFYSLELSSPSRAIIHPWNALNYTACTQRTFICDCTFLSVLPQTRIMYGIYNQIKYARLYRFRWIELIVVSNLGKVACTEWTEFGLCLRISTDSIRFFPFKCKMLEEKKCLCVRARAFVFWIPPYVCLLNLRSFWFTFSLWMDSSDTCEVRIKPKTGKKCFASFRFVPVEKILKSNQSYFFYFSYFIFFI